LRGAGKGSAPRKRDGGTIAIRDRIGFRHGKESTSKAEPEITLGGFWK